MQEIEEFKITFGLTVYGLEVESRGIFRQQFPASAGGANPSSLIPYNSVNCLPNEMENILEWLGRNLAGSYTGISISVRIASSLSWGEVIIPQEILKVAGKYSCEIKVLFSSKTSGQAKGT